MPEPMAPIVTPESGLDVRTPESLPDLPAESGVPLQEVPLAEAQRMPSGGDTQQRFVYSTVDQHGEIAASTAAVFLPTGEAPEGGRPALAWAHGTTGMGDNCTPSAGSRKDKVLVDHWVDAGYAVVASDYTGMGTPGLMSYFNGEATAVSVVDSVIAAQKLDSVGAQLSEKWAVAGQSQGGGAALHVAHGASSHSAGAGLDYRGAVATGAPAYVEELVLAGSPSFPPVALPDTLNAYVAYILAGFREAHPEVDLSSALTPEGRRVADLAETMCLDEMSENLSGKVLSGLFNRPLREVPGFAAALRDYMATPTDGYDKPMFLGHGLTDIDVPSPIGVALNSEMWVRQFTGGNEQVEVHRYPTDHSGAMLASVADSTPFLQRIMG